MQNNNNNFNIHDLHKEFDTLMYHPTIIVVNKLEEKEVSLNLIDNLKILDFHKILANNFLLGYLLVKNINYSCKILNTKIANTRTSFSRNNIIKFQQGEFNVEDKELNNYNLIDLLVKTKTKLLDNEILSNKDLNKDFMKLINDMITLSVMLYELNFNKLVSKEFILDIVKNKDFVFNPKYEIDLI